MSGISGPSNPITSKVSLGIDLPSNISGQGLEAQLMFLIAQGNSILGNSVKGQQASAMKLQNQLTQATNALNALVAALPADKNGKFQIPLSTMLLLYNNGLLPSADDKSFSSGVRDYTKQVEAYMASNPGNISNHGDKKHKIDEVSNDTAMVLKQAIDNFVSQKTNKVQKQSTGMTNLTNAINVKQNTMSTLIQNNASAFQKIMAQLAKLR